MKKVVIATALALLAPTVFAGDKEVLRDACVALKAPSQRSSCLAALDRILIPTASKPAAEPPKPARLSLRGMNCERYEFAELDAMPANELEALYCSYSAGVSTSESASNKMGAKHSNDPRMQAVILQEHIKVMEKCNAGMSKVQELASRKYPPAVMDCSKFQRAPAPAEKQPS